MTRATPRKTWLLLALAAVIGANLTLGEFRSGQISLFLSLAVLAVSLDLVWGHAGILSLGQLLPFGTAAYFSAKLNIAQPELSSIGIVGSVVLGAAVSYLVGVAAFRRRLSLIVVGLLTFMLSLTFEQIAEQWREVTGGFTGLTGVPRFNLFGYETSNGAQDLLISVVAILAIGAVAWLVSRPFGAVLIGIRENERRMEACGYDITSLKIWTFTLGGAIAGLAGALYVHRTGFVSPGIFGFTLATNVVLWTLIGGRGTIVGPVVGTLLINFASAALADAWLQYWVLATGVIFIAAVILVPEGVVPALLALVGRPPRTSRTLDLVELVGHETDTSSAIIDASNIEKRFGSFTVLSDISLTMDTPELRCLIGPNGAGKTTLLDLLCGQQGHQDGDVSMLGQSLTSKPAWQFARHGVSRKFQAPQVIDSLSVSENIAVAAWGPTSRPIRLAAQGWSAHVAKGSLEILDRTGLNQRRNDPAGELSHGEKQWLEIAMAMAGNCRVLLLDEPTAGMTVAESLDAAELLRQLHSEFNLPILIVEHDMAFIRAVADRVTVLARGGLLADGSVSEVENDPAVRAVYLGEAH